MSSEIFERIVRVETRLDALAETVNTTASDVRAIRDHMLTSKARSAGAKKVLAVLAAAISAGASAGIGLNALIGFFHR